MLKAVNISKTYNKTKVLDNIDFNIPGKSVAGIIGPNGAGKTTLIKILAGFEIQDNGTMYINGEKIVSFSQTKKYLSYMPEKMILYPDYFVNEFLSFFHSITGFKNRQLMNKLSIENILYKKIGNLSKGWHQRLKLYIALSNNKPLILLDEPFDGFDPLQMREIIKIFKYQNSLGRTFILSIHQLSDAQKICDYFVLLDAGIKIEEGSLDTLYKKFGLKSKNLEDVFLRALGK